MFLHETGQLCPAFSAFGFLAVARRVLNASLLQAEILYGIMLNLLIGVMDQCSISLTSGMGSIRVGLTSHPLEVGGDGGRFNHGLAGLAGDSSTA